MAGKRGENKIRYRPCISLGVKANQRCSPSPSSETSRLRAFFSFCSQCEMARVKGKEEKCGGENKAWMEKNPL